MNIEWEKISTQNTFESLVRALLSLEAPNARLFARPGADQGIDGLDQVTNTVYQLKFHKNGSSSKPIQDANAELAKVTEYRQTDPKPFWKDITEWVLITNVADNPQTTHQRWQDEIVPAFRSLNLKAVLWTTIDLEQMLLRHKHIYIEFFESEARHYLSLNEAIASLNTKGLRDNEYNTAYRERESDRGDFDAFLNSTTRKVFVVLGPGGVGKTRYLLECGIQARTSWSGNVYWANTAALESTGNFLGGVFADTANLIFIDEPSDPKFINVLLEQLSNPESRISKWKICIALRSQKDTMHTAVFQRQYRNLLEEKNLQELSDTQIEEIVAECVQDSGMDTGQLLAITQRIVNLSNGFPIWVHVALKMIEDGFDPNRIPEDRYNVAREYIDQLVNNVPGKLCEHSQMSVLIKWLGLFRDLTISDDDSMRFLNLELSLDKTKSISDLIEYLISKRLISKFGRLVKIKPDVIRDHVIFHTLGKPSTQPDAFESTSFGKELGKRILNERIPQFQKLLTSIDLAEVYFKRTDGNSLGILNSFGKELVETAKTGNTVELGTLLELSKSFAYSQPKIIAQLSLAVRSQEPVEPEIDDKIWGKLTIKASTLISKLPNLVKEASRYCIDQPTRDQLVREIIELLKHEVSIELKGEKLPNDGARSSHCIQKMIYGGPNFFNSYQNEFKNVALEYIESISSLNEIDQRSLKTIISPLVSLERSHSTFDSGTFTIHNYLISPQSGAYETRIELVSAVWSKLERSLDQFRRAFLIDLISESHKDIHRPYRDKTIPEYVAEEVKTLTKIKEYIESDWVSIPELRSAREIWEWNAKYDKRIDIKKLAEECEKAFLSKPRLSTFESIFTWRHGKEEEDDHRKLIDTFCRSLITRGTPDQIFDFIQNGTKFVDIQQFWFGAGYVIESLGNSYSEDAVQKFCRQETYSKDKILRKFALGIHSTHVSNLRKTCQFKTITGLVSKLVTDAPNNENIVDVLHSIYITPPIITLGSPSEYEFDLIVSNKDAFAEQGVIPLLITMISRIFYVTWPNYRLTVENALKGLSSNDAGQSLHNIIHTFHMFILLHDKLNFPINTEHVDWIVKLMWTIPDIGKIPGNVDYELNQLHKHVNWRPNYLDFLTFIECRMSIKESLGTNAEKRGFKFYPGVRLEIINFFTRLPDDRISKKDLINTTNKLLDLNDYDYPVGYHLPEWLAQLDPNGVIVPDLLIQRFDMIENIANEKSCYLWLRHIGAHYENSPIWRKLAVGAKKIIQRFTGDDRKKLLWSMSHNERGVWSSSYGEFHPRWQQSIDREAARVESEDDPLIKEFFELRLAAAKADFENEKLRHAEEHEDE